MPAKRGAWVTLVAVLLAAGCSNGDGKQSTAPTTAATRPSAPTARAVDIGPCPKNVPGASGPFNEGVHGLAKALVPLTATSVRVCSYQYLGTGSAALTSGTPTLPVAALEAETNRLERYPLGTDIGGGCVALPRDLFVTFANSSQRSSVSYTPGCVAPAGNRVLEAKPTAKWISDVEHFTDDSLSADVITGEWRPVSIAGYHGSLSSPPLALTPQLNFDGKSKWTGSDGCNYLGGSYRFGPGKTVHFTVAGTKRRCFRSTPPEPLQTATRAELANGLLRFLAPGGGELARYRLVSLLGP